jgi:pyruvate/2-oxoglutarate dehydrogenase complex dihydrolipoamide dehydrogenase (E3) component
MSQQFDAIVIGTGQAGPTLTSRLAAAGLRVAVIERDRFGGSCVNYGCTPTKSLVASARAAWMARRASEYGVRVEGSIHVDMEAVKVRKDAIVRKSTEGLEQWLKGMDNVTVVEGDARFTGSRAVEVNGKTVEAEKIFLNVGTRERVPPLPGIDEVDTLTSTTMMDVDALPEHLVIVGGSYIGLEFGQMYRRFGSGVTIVEMGPRLIGREDPDVSEAIQDILENEGVEVRTSAECVTLASRDGGVIVGADCSGEREDVEGSHVLLAVGRIPNTDTLGLEAAGIETDERGYVVVDDQLRTSAPGVWALGDCNGQGAFTHTSYNDCEIVAANLLDDDPRRVTDRIPCYGLFVDPPLGRIGMTEDQARATGRRVLMGKRPMTKVARAVEKGEPHGFMKVLVDADSERILGAAILGIGGDEVVHSMLDVMYADAPYTVISRAVHIHPTVAELVPTMLQDLRELEAKEGTASV